MKWTLCLDHVVRGVVGLGAQWGESLAVRPCDALPVLPQVKAAHKTVQGPTLVLLITQS